jgi:hypothetical protein
MNGTLAFLSLIVFSVAGTASGCKEGGGIGGCKNEIVNIGTGMVRAEEPPADASWIRICSVGFAGNEVYRQAALDLTAVLDTLGVTVYSRSELVRLKEGPCWPPYTVTIRIDAKMGVDQQIRTRLLETPLAGIAASAERPDDYGLFFVTCGWGSSDNWILWYPRPATDTSQH